MKGFISSFFPIFSKFRLEIILLSLAILITLVSSIFFFRSFKNESPAQSIFTQDNEQQSKFYQKILVEISGAVIRPEVYEMSSGARLKDVLKLSGGLSDEADRSYFSHNFNLARILNDQDKIYIPSVSEINSGIFLENKRTLDYTQPQKIANSLIQGSNKAKEINLNTATVDELDTIPSIGKSIALKIIQNRPYSKTEDLVTKKIIKKNLYESIKKYIQI